MPRVSCKEHEIKTIEVPWARSNSHFSYLFEGFSIALLQATVNQVKVSELLRISFSQIHTIMERAVERGMARREELELEYIGIDEKSMKKGHHYLTVVSDITDNKVIEVVEDRTKESVKSVLTTIKTNHNCNKLKAISMDMWKAFMTISAEMFPQADVVHDRFHLSKYLNDGVDKTRRLEATQLEKISDRRLKNTKYLFLKNIENMSDAQALRFAEVKDMNLDTSKVWLIKDTFKGFFANTDETTATKYFNDWVEDTRESGLKHMINVAEMFNRHWTGIGNYIKHRISNSISENLNGKIQKIKTIARGFRAFNNYRIAILFHL